MYPGLKKCLHLLKDNIVVPKTKVYSLVRANYHHQTYSIFSYFQVANQILVTFFRFLLLLSTTSYFAALAIGSASLE